MIFDPLSPPNKTIDWADGNTPKSSHFDDIYYSVENGLAESRHTFVEGLGITHDHWPDNLRVIGELGCGTGLNICALLDAYIKSSGTQPVNIISIEGYPLHKAAIRKALNPFAGELGDVLPEWINAYPDNTPNDKPTAIQLPRFNQPALANVKITIIFSTIDSAFELWPVSINADGWILDGFNPHKNPDMWSESTFNCIARYSNPFCKLATFTVAGNVKRGLQNANFTISKRPGYGKKRECLTATYSK
jgi:tRNA 5-methylaminomethyl-2-thiouridine biosynthesis bifunctional protein